MAFLDGRACPGARGHLRMTPVGVDSARQNESPAERSSASLRTARASTRRWISQVPP